MAKQKIQVNRELKWLDAKETDPSLLHFRELRGRSDNEESHMSPIRQLSPGLTNVHSTIQNSCISICHCLGVAVGSLETCTHVIPMPESHNLALVFTGIMYTFNHFF